MLHNSQFEDLSLTSEFKQSISHQYEEVVINKKKTFNCLIPDCGKTFKFKSEIKRHLAIHSESRPFVCSYPDCGKTFKRADALSNHARIHNRTTHFLCPVPECLSHFTTKSALRFHMLKHTGEKIYKCSCPGCDKAFPTQSQLKQHEKASYYHQKITEGVQSPSEEAPEKSTRSFDDFMYQEEDELALEYDNVDKRARLSNEDDQTEDTSVANETKLYDEKSPEINWDMIYTQIGNKKSEPTPVVEFINQPQEEKESNLEDTLMAMVNFAMQENQELKKKLQAVTDLLETKEQEKAIETQPEIDVDMFFKKDQEKQENDWFQESFGSSFFGDIGFKRETSAIFL